MMKRYAPMVSAAALLVLVGGMALASDSGNVISACVKDNGTIVIVDDVSECKEQQTPLEWNIAGPQGDPGPVGPPGEHGQDGASTSYYVVETVESVPLPPKPNPPADVDGSVVLAPGDLVLSCDPGDTAVDGMWFRTVTIVCHTPESAHCMESSNVTFRTTDPIMGFDPMTGHSSPTGYTNYTAAPMEAVWNNYTIPWEPDPFLVSTHSSYTVRVTCADVTP